MNKFKPAGWYIKFKLEGTGPTQIITKHYDTLTANATINKLKGEFQQPVDIIALWQAGTHKKICRNIKIDYRNKQL